MMDFPLINVKGSDISNYKTSKEGRFNVMDSRGVQFKNQSMIGYAQLLNSGSQVISGATRTQLTNNAQGTDTYYTEKLWNPINNRINLQDAVVGNYIDCQIFLPVTGVGFAIGVIVQLDYSPALDGSQVIGYPIANVTIGAGNYEVNIKFTVTQEMKDNGIGIMVTPTVAITITGAKVVLENIPSQTD